MSERQQVFDVAELQTLSCKCPKCGNRIVFALETDPKYGLPQGCPTCAHPLEEFTTALARYREFYRAAKDSALSIRIETKPVVE